MNMTFSMTTTMTIMVSNGQFPDTLIIFKWLRVEKKYGGLGFFPGYPMLTMVMVMVMKKVIFKYKIFRSFRFRHQK